mgnify:CR=1 FL=1
MKKNVYNVPENTKMTFPFSHAVETDGTIYLSGQPSMNLSTGEFVVGNFEAQFEQCFKNLEAVLEATGLNNSNVIKCTVFLIDMRDFVVMNELYKKKFEGPYPARSCFSVAGLPMGAKVEVEMIAKR